MLVAVCQLRRTQGVGDWREQQRREWPEKVERGDEGDLQNGNAEAKAVT